MSRFAFYAPMKPPDHPVPSGDREIARNLIAALGANAAMVETASSLRVYDPTGDAAVQARLINAALDEIARLVTHLKGQDISAWITYHNYYKAPDLIGPAVCRALDLPYVQIESTRARTRLSGPWAAFAAAAEAASDAAGLIFYLTERDAETLKRDRPPGQKLRHLRPFLPLSNLPSAPTLGPVTNVLSAGMMRPGDKLASYAIIADILAHSDQAAWSLDIAGDGPARREVEALMAPFGARVRFLGELDKAGMASAYANAALFLWPGVNEAFGMVYLEAQAAGLPVVAQDRPGLREVLAPGLYPPPDAGVAPLADRIAAFLADPALCRQSGQAARTYIATHHLLPGASQTLRDGIADLTGDTT